MTNDKEKVKMASFNEMDNGQLADCLDHWMGDALLAYDNFKLNEKQFFHQLLLEVGRRFIKLYEPEPEPEDDSE